MNINQANTNLNVRRLMGLKPPAPSYAEIYAEIIDPLDSASHWYDLLLPGIGITIVLASGGRALFDRMISPTTIAPTQTSASSQGQLKNKVAKGKGSSIYSVKSKSEQSIAIKTELSGKISKVFIKPGDRVKAGQTLFLLSVSKPSVQANNSAAKAKSSYATAESSPEKRKVSAQADAGLKQAEYYK